MIHQDLVKMLYNKIYFPSKIIDLLKSKGSVMKSPIFTIGTFAASAALVICLSGCSSTEIKAEDSESAQSTPTYSSDKKSSNSYSSSTPSSSSSSSSSSKSSTSNSSSSSSSTSTKKETDRYHDSSTNANMYKYSDGTSAVTDGWGNVWRDTDGDNDPDEYSTDSGKSWSKY